MPNTQTFELIEHSAQDLVNRGFTTYAGYLGGELYIPDLYAQIEQQNIQLF